MAVRDKTLSNRFLNIRSSKVTLLQKCGDTHKTHMLAGVKDSPSSKEKGVEISRQTTYAFMLGPSHPTPRNLLEIRKHHLHEVIHGWVALLKVDHDSQHKHNIPHSSINAEACSK